MHHAVGIGLLIFCIAYVFGKQTARVCVGAALIIIALAFLYVMVRIIMGTV